MFRRTILLAILATYASSVPAWAQPPVLTRWSGSTALAQPHGFSQGSPLTLTWGFMAPGTVINDQPFSGFASGTNDLQTFLNGIYGNQATWQPIFQSVFDRWSSISGLSYQYETNDDAAPITFTVPGPIGVFPAGSAGVRADVRIGGKFLDGAPPVPHVLAYNYYPNLGEMVIDTGDSTYNDLTSGSLLLRNIIAHEHGHGIGQRHVQSADSRQLMEPFLDTNFDGPQYHDILMAQHAYGDFNEKSSLTGNDVFSTATALGNLNNANNLISIGNDARDLPVGSGEVDFVSIDDDLDIDMFSFHAGTAGQLSILLESLGLTYGLTAQSGAGNVPFDTKQRSDLSLELLGIDGTTVLQTINATGLGGNESMLYNLVGGGTYYVRITGADNIDSIVFDTQFYGLTLGFAAAAIPEPGTWAFLTVAGYIGVCLMRRQTRRKSL